MDTATVTNKMSQDVLVGTETLRTSIGDDEDQTQGSERSPQLTPLEKQSKIFERILRLETDLIEANSESERLKIKLDESNRTAASLRGELDECKLTMFQNSEDSKKVHEEVQKNRKLEEDYVKLMSNFLNLSERYEQDRQQIYDIFMAKTNAINNFESLMSRDAIKHELEQCKGELNHKQADASLLSAKLRNMEEDNSVKEKCITELKRSLDDAKVTHKHEITVLEEYIQSLKNTITSYEKTLATYIGESEKLDEGSPVAVVNSHI